MAAVLAADGLGVARFGQEADAALAALKGRLGEAEDLGTTSCAPRITHQWAWGDGLSAYFAETFVGYRYILGVGGPALRTEAGIGEGSTVAQLKAAYPDGVTFTPDPAEGGSDFTVALPVGRLTGYAAGSGDTDRVVSFTVGEDCGE